MYRSLPVLSEEDTSEECLSMEIFAGGLENQSQLMGTKAQDKICQEHQTDPALSFINGLVHPEVQNETVAQFLIMVHSYCKQKNLILALTEHNPDHPVERFSRMFMACLLKLHDLVQLALLMVTTENSPPHFPSALADICKLVYDAKLTLVKSRQESSCTYDEICGPAIDRCLFLIDNIRSPATDVYSMLHRHQLSSLSSRWKRAAQKALTWQRKRPCSESDDSAVNDEKESHKKVYYKQQVSSEKKSLDQTHEVKSCYFHCSMFLSQNMSWTPVTLEIASSRKFKWLRERVGTSSHHTLLLNQIKNFVFTDDVDVKMLCTVLKRQVLHCSLYIVYHIVFCRRSGLSRD